MPNKPSSSKKRKKSRVPQMLRIAAAAPPLSNVLVMICLLASGVFEGVGIASLLPLLAAAGDPTGAKQGAFGKYVMGALDAVGLPHDLLILLGILVAAMIAKALLHLMAMRQVGHAVAQVGTKMRLQLITALLEARWSFFTREPLGRFANAIGFDAMRASEAYSAVSNFMAHIIQTLIYLGIAAAFSWKLAGFAFAVGVVMMLSLSRFIVTARRNARKQTKRTTSMIGRLADVLIGLKPMKAMGRHARFAALFAKDIASIDLSMRRQLFARHASRVLQEPVVLVCVGIGTYVAATFASIPLAELMIMALLLVRTVMVIGKIQEDLQAISVSESGYWSIYHAIQDAATAKEATSVGRAPTLESGIELRDVSMAFGSKRVVDHASFTVAAGEVTAVIGASGAGKTTLVDLILGLHQPTAGQILIDGQPISAVDIMKWRMMVGYVPQELLLYHDSIMANVTLGETTFTRADVERALKQAGAWNFVSALSDGIDHIVGERGGLLSGGQRQRIAMARALIHRPQLLILDEATSALDPATEAEIVRNVRELSRQSGITVLSISHQPAWMTVADRVIRVQDGVVSEATPASLTKLAVS
jgi:ATP-binding cassette subfamily C protein